jgi:hypothetical protein
MLLVALAVAAQVATVLRALPILETVGAAAALGRLLPDQTAVLVS